MGSRGLEVHMFAGLRVASTYFTPAYSNNGKNVSAKLTVNAFQNFGDKKDGTKAKKNEAVSFTVWGKLAETCAKSMSPGKEFNCKGDLNVYRGKTYFPSVNGLPGIQVMCPDGAPLMQVKTSFTVRKLTFGGESKKHINNELQAGVRPIDWDRDGTPDQAQWVLILQGRQAMLFDPALPTYGYASVRMPQGANIAAPIAQTAAGVAVTLAGVNPAAAIPATAPVVVPAAVPATAPVVAAGGFITAPKGV